jgi:hypothetical protein
VIVRTRRRPRPLVVRQPAARGWPGRGAGSSQYLQAADEWRATTVQACGLWPFAVGTGSPMIGVPLGRHLVSGATMCSDPISWFQRANLISNPSVFALSKPGLGKSTVIRRMALGLTGYGVMPLVLGDLKPDYVDLITALGGQVIKLGRGRGNLNILDPGEATAAAARLSGSARDEVLADARGRRQMMVATLITIMRSAAPTDREELILDRAVRVLDERHHGVPVLSDLIQVIEDAPDEVRHVAMDRGDMTRYQDFTDGLLVSLKGMLGRGRVGEMFSAPTSTPMRRDVPVVFDVSSIEESELALQGAALMACWSYGFGAINVANALAAAGLEPQRHYFAILDELWRGLRAGHGMVDRIDALTRLNRARGVGVAMISHTLSDLEALPDPHDQMKARGFVERSGMVICGGLPASEMPKLNQVIALSNAEQQMLKRDLVDATRGPRSEHGEVWVFDPQGIVGETAEWWWNPLSFVTDEVRAEILADIFASASRDPGARTDAYFEPAGQQLLANLLLAAALAQRSITQVYLWLSNPTDDEPVSVLQEHGYPLLAAALQAVVNAPEKQRGGVYGTATQIASFLTNRQAMQWVTPDGGRERTPARALADAAGANPWLRAGAGGAKRREFHPEEFVRTQAATIYSVSKEGRGNAGPLVTALTVAITEAAEDLAKVSPGGRLATPLVAVLDEAANVCRWRELPNVYSHYGSRGICILTILQSWSQGVDVWGREGMRKLWSAANVKVYGGGVSETEFLEELSRLIGDFDLFTNSVNYGRGQRSSTRSTRRERVLDVADLSALPRGRVIVFASGARATLARSLPWMDGPHADAVRASIRRFDPVAERTIATAGADPDDDARAAALA